MCGCEYCQKKIRYPIRSCNCANCGANRWTPFDEHGKPPPIEGAITQAVGAASMCWEDVSSAGKYDVEQALWISDGIQRYVNSRITTKE